MGLPVERLLALGVGATGVAVGGSLFGPMGSAVAGVVSGAMVNFFANLAQPAVDPAGDSPNAHRTRQLASGALELWMSEAAAADSALAPLDEQSATKYFATDAISFENQTALDEQTWQEFLSTLATATAVDLPESLRGRLAHLLHTQLPQMLRALVKKDFTGNTEAEGRGFASLELVLLGRIVAGIDRLLESQAAPNPAAIEQIERFNSQVAEAAARQSARIKDPRERVAVSRVLEQINQLRPHIDKRLNELTRVVSAEGHKTRREVRGVDRKVAYVFVSVAGLAVVSGLGWWLIRNQQIQTWIAISGASTRSDERQAELLAAQAKVTAAIEDLKLRMGGSEAHNEYSPDVLAAAKLLQERGTKEQRALGDMIAGKHKEADELLDQLLADRGKSPLHTARPGAKLRPSASCR